jgi:peptidylprolyl isomerase
MTIKNGSVVCVHYTGALSDGTTFDTSRDREPMEFTVGEGMVIPGFEKSVIGRKAGDKYAVTVTADEGYGEYAEELIFRLPRSELPAGVTPEVGLCLELVGEEGELEATIIELNDDTVLFDANHELAGEELIFEIEIISAR